MAPANPPGSRALSIVKSIDVLAQDSEKTCTNQPHCMTIPRCN
jgi:hypothetical protein